MKAAKRKDVHATDPHSDFKEKEDEMTSTDIPSELPKSPSIFNDEFAPQPLVQESIGRPDASVSSHEQEPKTQEPLNTSSKGGKLISGSAGGAAATAALPLDNPAGNGESCPR